MSSSSEAAAAVEETIDVAGNLEAVRSKIEAARNAGAGQEVRLVAVSKTKSVELIQAAYEQANQRVFGENYAQELVQKATDLAHLTDIRWHFIGGLQSNKANALVNCMVQDENDVSGIARLTIETVASVKLANKLNNAVQNVCGGGGESSSDNTPKLSVFVQINTSGEDSKSGIEPSECVELCRHVVEQCPHLKLQGLMTIGAVGDVSCFAKLRECRESVLAQLDLLSNLELSMGMSGDYGVAISEYGATNVRVGSTIFGARDYK